MRQRFALPWKTSGNRSPVTTYRNVPVIIPSRNAKTRSELLLNIGAKTSAPMDGIAAKSASKSALVRRCMRPKANNDDTEKAAGAW